MAIRAPKIKRTDSERIGNSKLGILECLEWSSQAGVKVGGGI